MFTKARIRLTLWYLAILMTISICFSAVIYRLMTDEIDKFAHMQQRRLENRWERFNNFLPPNETLDRIVLDLELVDDIKDHLAFSLMLINLGIVGVAGICAYMLAGITLRPIQQMLEDQQRFISDASHELRTPLTSLKTAFEVYQRDPRPTKTDTEQLVTESLQEVENMHHLTDSLLRLTQQGRLQNPMRVEEVSLLHTMKKALRTVSPLVKAKEIAIALPTEDVTLVADARLLQELWTILLDNAVKYSGEKTSVEVALTKKRNHVTITMKDHGVGIAHKDIPHIFDRFYRADASRCKQEHNGYGLGLPIARHIVERHHGTITVESVEGNGSTFIVTLPIKRF